MGTCCSINRENPSTAAASPSKKKPARLPPEPEAEEKEVLSVSETPKSIPRPSPKQLSSPEQKIKQELTVSAATKGLSGGFPVPVEDCDDWSEDASEAYSASLSESLSASTATLTEKEREKGVLPADEEKVRRSPMVAQAEIKHQRNGRSVAVGSRSSPSPVKITADAEAIGSTDSGCESSAALREFSSGARRETGERSGRRSVSPGVKRVAADMKEEELPASATSTVDEIVDREGQRGEGKEEEEEEEEEEESLDNPLVSLECFIFL